MPDRPASIKDNVLLAPYTTMKIGGPAKYFAAPKTIDEVREIVRWAGAMSIPYRLIGRGANLLIADKGYNGLVMVMRNDRLDWNPPQVVAGAGVQNGQLLAGAMKHNLGGLQWLIGVPGTVGGSIYGNAGGHGWGLGDQVEWVEALTPEAEIKRLSQTECRFAYRTSIFKSHSGWIILRAGLQFPSVDVASERRLLADTSKQKNAGQPTAAKTAGCMFTNPRVEGFKLPEELQKFVTDGTISAWRLIEHVGLKGRRLGQIEISPKHANFMINLGGGTADEVMQLLSLVKQRVRDILGIQLHEEVQYLGF